MKELGSEARKSNHYTILPPCALPILLWGLETVKKAWTLESNHLGSNPSSHAYWGILENLEKNLSTFLNYKMNVEELI